MNHFKSLIDAAGGPESVGKVCGISARAVYKWIERGRMPRTEYSGETEYCALIEEATGGRVTAESLLNVGAKKEAA